MGSLTVLKLIIDNADNIKLILVRKQDFHLNYKYSINYEYNCFSIVNSFLDLNKNLERTIVVKNRCNYIT